MFLTGESEQGGLVKGYALSETTSNDACLKQQQIYPREYPRTIFLSKTSMTPTSTKQAYILWYGHCSIH